MRSNPGAKRITRRSTLVGTIIVANNNKQQSGNGNTSWQIVLGTVASLLAVLGFFGITNIAQLRDKLTAGSHTPTSPSTAPFTLSPSSSSYSPTPDAEEDTPSPTPTVSTFDPDSLNDSSTDDTPFTQSALLAVGFTDRLGVRYKRVATGVHGCTDAYAMTSDVRGVLNGHGCTVTVTGDYLVNSATVTDRSDILVSVQVFAFDNSSTAQQVYDSFPKDGAWNFGIWCPRSGRGEDACSSGYQNARKSGYIRKYHRYLMASNALYTTLGTDTSLRTWVDAAASKAVDVCGPENYDH